MENLCYNLSINGKNTGGKGKITVMDRNSNYMNCKNDCSYLCASDAAYHDYFAELVLRIWRAFSNASFLAALSVICFMSALVFTVGVVGGIERGLFSFSCGIPLSVMLVCLGVFFNKARR